MRQNFLRENRRDDFVQTLLHLGVVGDTPRNSDVTGAAWRDSFFDQPAGIDEHPRAGAFFESMLAQTAHLVTELGELRSGLIVDAGLMGDDLRFVCLFGKVKLQGDETLARAVFEIFENVLIARIIGHHE